MEYSIISGELVKRQRGDRSLREVAKTSGHAFSAAALFKWEKGKAQPRKQQLENLLSALGCSYNDIAVPMALEK